MTSRGAWADLDTYAQGFQADSVRLCSVYRLYDADDNLLYIGCTSDVSERVQAHRRGRQPWRRLIASVDVDPPLPMVEARHAEARAIWAHQPPYNVHHRGLPQWLLVRNPHRIPDRNAGWQRPENFRRRPMARLAERDTA